MNRRDIIFSALAGLTSAKGAPPARYRVAIIGDTGRGNYGHDWDVAWNSIPKAEVVAVADPDETGRRRALSRSHARKGYADYREMLATEHPDIVTICPRWLDQRVAMVTAAAEAGAHILTEKPFAQSLPEADEMLATIERRGIKVQVGHTARVAAVIQIAGKMQAPATWGRSWKSGVAARKTFGPAGRTSSCWVRTSSTSCAISRAIRSGYSEISRRAEKTRFAQWPGKLLNRSDRSRATTSPPSFDSLVELQATSDRRLAMIRVDGDSVSPCTAARPPFSCRCPTCPVLRPT